MEESKTGIYVVGVLSYVLETKEKEQESVICLVCHQGLKEYIILPNCQAPHIYCMSCANKLIKQGAPQNDYYGYRYVSFTSH